MPHDTQWKRLRQEKPARELYRHLPLNQRQPSSKRLLTAAEEDVHPDSDASLLRKHLDDDRDGQNDTPSDESPPLYLKRLPAFMSRMPLLSQLQKSRRTEPDATHPSGGLTDGGDVSEPESYGTDHERTGDRQKEFAQTSRAEHSPNPEFTMANGVGISTRDGATSFEGLEPLLGNESASKSTSSADEAVDVNGKSRQWSDENPYDNSPYPQVRASVSAIDNTSLSICTPRMWILSLLFALVGSAANLFFSLRYPSVAITPVIALVLVHPLGRAWDIFLKRDDDPDEDFENGTKVQDKTSPSDNITPSSMKRLRLFLAQGRWNEKEHACVYISSNVSFGFAFATDVIVEQHKFYHQNPTIVYQLLLTISTQILGYAFAGLTRRYLVRPSSMIWPGTLMSTAMFSTMHKSENKIADGWKISRWKFFIYVWIGAFCWYFIPGLLMPALSYFNVLTWFAPSNVVVANLFGVSSGLGLFPMTFDWAQIAYIGSPLLTPWWAAANVVGGLVIVMWVLAPALYYSNALYSSFMPILSSAVFDNTGKPYDVSRILTPDFLFDKEAYQKYSRVYLPITYVLSYTAQFASLSALVTHTVCWHGTDIWQQTKQSLMNGDNERKMDYQPISQGDTSPRTNIRTKLLAEPTLNSIGGSTDVHNRLMSRYDDCPISWYITTFVAMLTIGIFVVEYYPEVRLPWYGLLLALGITSIMFVPVGIIMAITNQHSSLYLVSQLICGVIFPGRPVANMIFVTYCYISSAQGVKFSADLKLGHYMKIPPKLLFAVQMAATLVSSITQIAVLNWMFVNIPRICTPEAVNGFTCPIARVHFNGSILWGVVGPGRFFGKGALYRHLIWAFLIGAIAPVLLWLIARHRSTTSNQASLLRKISLPVLFGSLSWIPPATGLNFSVWALVCFVFNYVLRRRAGKWWAKYTMTLSAALDSALAFAVLVVFFGFVYPGWMEGFSWWGTEVYKQGCDWKACSYRNMAPGERFGPD